MSEPQWSNKSFYIILTLVGGIITLYGLTRTDRLNINFPSPPSLSEHGKFTLNPKLNISELPSITIPPSSSSTISLSSSSTSAIVEHNSSLNSITDRSFYSTNNTVYPPAVIVRTKGGIGNQLFEAKLEQYACHYAIARRNNWPLYTMVPAKYKTEKPIRKWGFFNREFVLDQFHIPIYDWNTIDSSWNITFAESITDTRMLSGDYPLDKVIQQTGGDYCQSEAFFSSYRDELLEFFVQNIDLEPIKEWVEKIDASESVAVHVRRGDFVRLNVSVPLSFHRNCMKEIVKRLEGKAVAFFLFSDDINYVNQHLLANDSQFSNQFPIYAVTDEKKTTSLQELFLMSRCKHQIIPDSTFSWWGAYLNRNPDKIIYAAHYRESTIESMYGSRKDFYLWLYKHMYYPVGWTALVPDWAAGD